MTKDVSFVMRDSPVIWAAMLKKVQGSLEPGQIRLDIVTSTNLPKNTTHVARPRL